MRLLILFFFVSVTAYGQPDWTQETKRRVIGGHIIHIGKGTAVSADLAAFKAEMDAYKKVINECGGMFSTNMKIGERHDAGEDDGVFTAYAQAVIQFSDCESAKAGKGFENNSLKESMGFYDALLVVDGEPELLKKVNWKETSAMVQEFQEKIQWELERYKKEILTDVEVAYAKQQAEIDSLSEELSAMKEEQAWKKFEKELAKKQKQQEEEFAKYSPAKKKCFAELKRLEHQVNMQNRGLAMNGDLNVVWAKAAECKQME